MEMRAFLGIPLVFAVVLLSGCASISPEALAMANPLVKQFMEQYPNAKITVNHFTADQAAQMLENISAECGNPYVAAKEYYRISIDDPDSGLKAISWVDWETRGIECAVKYGGGGNKTISKPDEPVQTCKSRAEANCYGDHVYWFDSCGHREEKKEFCSAGCENGFCKANAGDGQKGEFCGTSSNAACSADSDCAPGGCSGQVCEAAGEGSVTTCEYRECYNAGKFDKTCKCVEGKCQWKQGPDSAASGECVDSDGGKDIYTAGDSRKGSQSLSEHCNADGTLTEKYCENNEIKAETVGCPEGFVCREAACAPAQ